MTSASKIRKSEVGEVRPSQTLTTYGIGSLVDLPNLSVIVMGLEDWPISHSAEISEERLLVTAQKMLGPQVKKFHTPPQVADSGGTQAKPFDDSRLIGVPVAPFPRWMVCTRCRLLAPLRSGLFEAKVSPYRPDKTAYFHNCSTQSRSALVIPARFMVTCERGHLDDFPWLEFVHKGPTDCNGPLRMIEFGPSGEMADVTITCDKCEAKRRLVEVVGPTGAKNLPVCNARRPHLRDYDANGCDCKTVRPVALGASNLWFPVIISALSVPEATDDLGRLIEDNWAVLANASSREVLTAFRAIGKLRDFAKYTDDQVWKRIEQKQAGTGDTNQEPSDLKTPEWRVFTNPGKAKESRSFKLRQVDPPEEYAQYFEKIVLAEKLREVKALVGFTRIMSPRDFDNPVDVPENRRAAISRKKPSWLPASETRGEGIFFQFNEERIQQWVKKQADLDRAFLRAHVAWKNSMNIPDPEKGYPGIRFVLIHSFAHALIRQLAIECGYTSASMSERIYSQNPDDGPAMAGVLIYTSAPDSEGTLGGLCALGDPDKLGRHIKRALEKVTLCSSDPLCSEHEIGGNDTLHAAACHACSFLPETSCERGNKYLDRAVLVPTLERNAAFFG